MSGPQAFYNEIDPSAATWLRELIKAGLIAPGDVDERPIQELNTHDLEGYTQCHFFAGIGGWSYALRLAGWPDSRPVWTGSCPCQPHSSAARGRHTAEDLWLYFRELIATEHPAQVFGEQVAAARTWLDVVCDDMEALDYAFAAAILPAVCVGKDHRRDRIYFVGDSNRDGQSVLPVYAETPRMQRDSSDTSRVVSTDGVSDRMAMRGFGNAIVPQVAQVFIESYLEAVTMTAGQL